MHPGYVRVVIDAPQAPPRVRAACRRFARSCREEDARGGLIVAGGCGALYWKDALAESGAGFRLAIVARGAGSADVARDALCAAQGRGAAVRIFKSEHQAAAWLMARR